MKLSKRLELVASFVPAGSRVADVGTDHGYVPIWLVEQGIAVHGLAMDVRKGPLLRADAHIRQHGLEANIETRLSDGLQKLRPGEADVVVIAGMGGELMLRILKEGSHVWDSVARFVLSPQSELETFRRGLEELGFVICREEMLMEEGKYYTVMAAERGEMHYDHDYEYRYGALLIQNRSEVLAEFLKKETKKLEGISRRLSASDTEGARERRREVEQERIQIKEAYDALQRIDQGTEPAGAGIHGL